ncbi:hypothetical protein GQ600_819 [Phytophthora cactorum]|nr:hypothetical protein GQ600_819 [Phytophthora cactorum]
MLLGRFKHFTVTKCDLSQCCICSDAVPHAMHTHLLQCGCSSCLSASPSLGCPWLGRVWAYQMLDVVAVDEVHAHVTPLLSPTKPRLTEPTKTAVRDWAAHGLRPATICRSLTQRFNFFEASTPPISVAQRFVHHYVAKRLGGSDVLTAVRLKAKKSVFTGDENEPTPFTITWNKDSQRPRLGRPSCAPSERAGLLRETRLQLNNISFLLGNNDNEDSRHIVKVFAIPATRIYDVIDKRLRQNLQVIAQLGVETTRMEHSACLCWDRPSMLKHELALIAFAASTGAACTSCSIAISGRATLVYRGSNKRKRALQVGQTAGRPRTNGPALSKD